jgi:hypothetical protein
MRPRCSLRNRLAEKLLPRPDVNLKDEKIQLATARLGLPRLAHPHAGNKAGSARLWLSLFPPAPELSRNGWNLKGTRRSSDAQSPQAK